MRNIETLEKMKEALLRYDSEGCKQWALRALEDGVEIVKIIDGLTGTVKKVGDAFGTGELFLPDLMGAGQAMQSAMSVITTEMTQTERLETCDLVVIGTVHGDIHNIGKDLVSTFLTIEGFEVIDLGVDVPSEKFLEAVAIKKPDLLAMSSLMTTTAFMQKKVIQMLEKENLRSSVKVIVGGGAITPEFAEKIGADGYGATAPEAPGLAKRLLSTE